MSDEDEHPLDEHLGNIHLIALSYGRHADYYEMAMQLANAHEAIQRHVIKQEAQVAELSRKAKCFDLMVRNGWYLHEWKSGGYWKVYHKNGDGYIGDKGRGATPEEAVERAAEGLEKA